MRIVNLRIAFFPLKTSILAASMLGKNSLARIAIESSMTVDIDVHPRLCKMTLASTAVMTTRTKVSKARVRNLGPGVTLAIMVIGGATASPIYVKC